MESSNRLAAFAQFGGPSSERTELSTGSALHHKLSLATTRSTSSASSTSHRSYPVAAPSASAASSSAPHLRPSQHPHPPEALTNQASSSRNPSNPSKRLPIYIRIVPKDIWLRIHIHPKQTIGSIKDAALNKAQAPDHDPSLSYRFYQDALNASTHAKIAPVASHDKVVKHRSYALPRTFLCPPPDLEDVAERVAERLVETRRREKERQSGRSTPGSRGTGVPPLPVFDVGLLRNVHSQAQLQPHQQQRQHQQQSASSGSQTRSLPLSGCSSSSARTASDDAMASSSAHVTRQISNSTLATFSPSTPSDFGAVSQVLASIDDPSEASDRSHSQSQATVSEIAIDIGAPLITGNRDAKLEEEIARMRLTQWSTAWQTSSSSYDAKGPLASPQTSPRALDSYNSTPTIASSSQFDSSETGLSPNLPFLSSFDASCSSSAHNAAQREPQHRTTTPPRRPPRSEQRASTAAAAAPAIFYTQPGAAESFNSLASLDSTSSAEFVTTADDEGRMLQWGTQAEGTQAEGTQAEVGAGSPARSPLSAAFSTASSPVRPRSRTVTAADVIRSRNATNQEQPPPMPGSVSSPLRISSLPRAATVQGQGGKMVAEESQRRAVPSDLWEMLKGSAITNSTRRIGGGEEGEGDDDDDDDMAFSTVQQRRTTGGGGGKEALTLRKKSSEGSVVAGLSSPSSTHSTTAAGGGYLAGIRLDEISRGWSKDTSHPLSAKFAVLSAANGMEMEEWKTVASYQLGPFELLELQWSIPTERVYIPPVSLHDIIRPPHPTSNSGNKEMYNPTCSYSDAGPDTDSACLEPYFEGWVYVLKTEKGKKMGKWKLHFLTVKGWRVDLYGKKPRAGEAVLPIADQLFSLRGIEWVLESESVVPASTALPALETLPAGCLSVAFAPRGEGMAGTMVGVASTTAGSNEGSLLTVRCINPFDHDSLSSLLLRAWYRSSATTLGGVDIWRRKAVFRATVAGRGGTVAAGKAGRGRGSRNSKARTRLRPSGWAREWEDADLWSSESEREEVTPPPELVVRLEGERERERERRVTVTQAKTERKKEVDEKGFVTGGLYAALLGRTGASTTAVGESAGQDSWPYQQGSTSRQRMGRQPQQEPSLMLGFHSLQDRRRGRQRSGSLTRSSDPQEATGAAGDTCTSGARSGSVTVSNTSPGRGRSSNCSANSSRNVSRAASPPGAGERKGYAISPALVPGFVDAPPAPSVALLRKYKASTKGTSGKQDD
ncbi:hypothetical protein NDA14_002789 [Ustilago hordei]|nr:hypothetical protein NDA14_002789 [Ustilago hordei]